MKGTVSDHPWATYDLLDTFADFARVSRPVDTDGISMRPFLEGRAADRPSTSTCTGSASEPDPGETVNLAPLQPAVVDELVAHMEEAHVPPQEMAA